MVGGQADVKLVSNAMANATRRKIMAMLVEGNRTMEEISKSVPSMLDYHLQMLQQAGLIEIKDGLVVLTDFGKNFMETKTGEAGRGQERPCWHKAPGSRRAAPALALYCRQHQVQNNRPV